MCPAKFITLAAPISEISIPALATRVMERLDSLAPPPRSIKMVPYSEAYGEGYEDMLRRVPFIDKIGTKIGWQPQRDLDTIIDDKATHMVNQT